MEMMDESYWDVKLAEIPPEVLRRAIVVLYNAIPSSVQANIVRAYRKHGHNWPYHHPFITKGWNIGRPLRNSLRQAGLTDDLLPDKNWDDYAYQVVEIAVGIRPNPLEE